MSVGQKIEIHKISEQSVYDLQSKLKSADSDYLDYYRYHHSRKFQSICRDESKVQLVRDGKIRLEERYFKFGSTCQMNLVPEERSDFENAKKVYECFSFSPLEANDPRIWVRLSHDQCHEYVVKRWGKKDSSVGQIQDRFFFNGKSLATRVRNGIARLWWIAHLTVDESSEDKWRYTKIIFDSQDIITSLLERRLGCYREVRLGFLEFYEKNKIFFSGPAKSKRIQQTLKDLNNNGGVELLSLLSRGDIIGKLQSLQII